LAAFDKQLSNHAFPRPATKALIPRFSDAQVRHS